MPIGTREAEAADPICKLPQEVGPCRSMLQRWWYDASIGKCVEFVFGGCRGNANNFESKVACEAKCGQTPPPTSGNGDVSSDCHLPRIQGKCRFFSPRWAFDASLGECVQFLYSGCDGNANNFESKSACEQRCLGELTD